MATYPFQIQPGQYKVYTGGRQSEAGLSRLRLGDDEVPHRVYRMGDGTPKGVTFTEAREEVTLSWEWIDRFDKSILEIAVNTTAAQDKEPRTIITDTYKEYLLLLTVVGRKDVYGVEVEEDEDGPSKCYLYMKGPGMAKVEQVEGYLALVQYHCQRGCPYCTSTKSMDTKNMAYRHGQRVYAMCFTKKSLLPPLQGVVTLVYNYKEPETSSGDED